jgi:hypothetical protein
MKGDIDESFGGDKTKSSRAFDPSADEKMVFKIPKPFHFIGLIFSTLLCKFAGKLAIHCP